MRLTKYKIENGSILRLIDTDQAVLLTIKTLSSKVLLFDVDQVTTVKTVRQLFFNSEGVPDD